MRHRIECWGGPRSTMWYRLRSHWPSLSLLNMATVQSATAHITRPRTWLRQRNTIIYHSIFRFSALSNRKLRQNNSTYTILRTESFSLIECKHRFQCETAEWTKMHPFWAPSHIVGSMLDDFSNSSMVTSLSENFDLEILLLRVKLKFTDARLWKIISPVPQLVILWL